MKTEKDKGPPQSSPSRPRKCRFSLRGRQKKEAVLQGKLRIRSMPGVFLVLGVIVVVVGTALAVAGYWPYRIHRSPLLGPGAGDQASGWSLGAKGLLSTARVIHSERMKLLGPVIMGVGLFIVICANTVLYENRDRETQMLLAQMRSVICSVSAVVPSADLSEMAVANSMARHYQWLNSLPAAHLNILCLQQMTSSEPLLQTRGREGDDRDHRTYQLAILRTEALHHQESTSSPSLHSSRSDSCDSGKADLHAPAGAGAPGGRAAGDRPARLSKLNDCLTSASSMSTLGGEDWAAPAALPRRCHSMSCRTSPRGPPTLEPPEAGALRPGGGARTTSPLPTRRETSSEVCVNMAGPPGEEVGEVGEAATHRSWPRLDLGCARRYLKLENQEDSVDRLLDRLEQQCSQWDKSYGSGPFQ
ncbi:transmembrane protein 200A [Aplochiton taeniatus]